MDFLEEDEITPGDWLLTWHQNEGGTPRKNGMIEWIYVHHVVPDGIKDETYTKLVGQAQNLHTPAPPFSLDPETNQIIRDALSSGNFPELLQRGADKWKLAPADKKAKEFIQHIKNESRRVES